ncbi:MAG: ribonuclease R, partial [Bacteroidota bacterium]
MKKKILTFLARYPGQSFKPRELARRLNMRSDEEYRSLKESLHQLHEAKQIRLERRGKVGHLHLQHHTVGELQIKKQGLGFVTVPGKDDRIFIAPRFLGTAMHGDTVEVSLFAEPAKKKKNDSLPEGEIVRVLK